MPTKLTFSLIAFIFFGTSLFAQNIQWASDLEFQFNNYGNQNWSGQQSLGKPDAMPYGSTNPKAFRLNSYSTYGTLLVSFRTPQFVQQLVILESFGPGKITDIFLYDDAGKKYHVYKNTAKNVGLDYRSFCLRLHKTRYKVKKVEITINSTLVKGWCQIDAIGIADANNINSVKEEIAAKGIHNFEVENSFTSVKEDLGITINTNYSEVKPIISPDGNTLYFSRKNFPGNSNGKADEQDIYYAEKQFDGSWSLAKNIGSPLNNHLPNGVSGVSADGNKLLLINLYQVAEDGSNLNGASISQRTRTGWGFPEKLYIKDFYNNSQYADYALSSSGNVLLMAIERNDSRGDQDIYVSFLEGENIWSSPINVGSVINTGKAEFSPFLAADDKTLYFASNGHGGFGGSDIFFTQRIDDSWTQWTTPQNLGKYVNSKDWDAYYSIPASGDFAYFVHGKGSGRNPMNIYRIALPQELRPDPVILVKGRILQSKNELPVAASLFLDESDQPDYISRATSNPQDGTYSMIIPYHSNHRFIVQANGYESQIIDLDVSEDVIYQELERDIYLDTKIFNPVIQTNKIYFAEGNVEILPESQGELDDVLNILRSNESYNIEISGHTDNRGSIRLKHELSKMRAEKIREFLVNAGIGGDRIKTNAFGGTKPVASNEFEDSRRYNRRVEVKILR